MVGVPYERARSGDNARNEIIRLLRRFDAQEVGFAENFERHALILHFLYRGQAVRLEASAAGWASMYLNMHPWNSKRQCDKSEWERKALERGRIVVSSILRDWIKGQLTAIESGILKFHHVFLPYMLTDNGSTVAQVIDRRKIEFLPDLQGIEGDETRDGPGDARDTREPPFRPVGG